MGGQRGLDWGRRSLYDVKTCLPAVEKMSFLSGKNDVLFQGQTEFLSVPFRHGHGDGFAGHRCAGHP